MTDAPEPQGEFNFALFNAIQVQHAFVLPIWMSMPVDSDFMYPTDGMICLVSGAKELKPDYIAVRINGVWKSTNLQ